MIGVILAAGRGGRIRGITGNQPKCLLRVGKETILERQIRALRACGVHHIVVVGGYQAPAVHRLCGPTVTAVRNRRFASTNSLYSLWLAREHLAGGFVVLNSDVIFPVRLLEDLLTARYDDALLMAPRGRGEPFSDEEMKVRVRRGLVVAIDKGLADDQADGENVGVAKFGTSGARVLVEEMQMVVGTGAFREWLPRAFAGFCRRRRLHVVKTRGYPWIEIDFPEDYWRACREIVPAVDALDRHHLVTGRGRGADIGPRSACHHV